MDGDFALSESNAILQYAAELSGSEKRYPTDLKQRADLSRWLLWEAVSMRPADGSEGSDFAALRPGRSFSSPAREFVWSNGAAIA